MRRNLRRIPQNLIDRIKTFDVDDVVAACAKQLRPEDITSYWHIGLKLEDGNLVLPSPPDTAAEIWAIFKSECRGTGG